MTNDRILDKIKKCLALSKSSNEHEAAAALRQAQKMMAAHNLTLDEVELGKIVTDTVTSLATTSRVKAWENKLAHGVKSALGIELLWLPATGEAYGKFVFIGPKGDVEVAKFLWTTLARKTYAARAEYAQQYAHRARSERTELADSFAYGYATTVVSKIEKFMRPAHQMERIANYTKSMMSATAAKTQNREIRFGAFHDGKQQGESVQLRHGMNTSAEKQRALTA